jgi:hypothetical protein
VCKFWRLGRIVWSSVVAPLVKANDGSADRLNTSSKLDK